MTDAPPTKPTAADEPSPASAEVEAALDGDAAAEAHLAEAAGGLEEQQLGWRHLTGWAGFLIAALAAVWSVFQLWLPLQATLDSDQVRSVHLVFAIVMVYLSFPMLRRWKPTGVLSCLSDRRRLPVMDCVLAVVAAGAAAYYALNYEAIAGRQGDLTARDMVFGMALIVLLLEAARRAFGPTLSVVAAAFIVYSFTSEHMPGALASKGISINSLVNQLAASQEGIYGLPLSISASTVFLFVLLGAMLEKTGGGRYFVQLAFSLLGRYKGGPAKASVLASGLTGMVSGSSIANVVTTGTFTIPLMKRSGYPAEKAAAVEVAASTNGQLMPPIMGAAAFIIAEYCNLPYLSVVRAAFIPAVVSYLALIYITHLEACKLGLRGLPKAQLPRFGATFIGGVHFLIPIGVLVWMLVTGFSPQFAAFYGVLTLTGLVLVREVLVAMRRRRGLVAGLAQAGRLIGSSLIGGGKGMMGVGVACATAGIIVGIVGLGLGGKITEIVATLSGGNILLVLLMTALASLILGMGLPTTATYIVMASLTAGVIVQLGGAAGLAVPLIAAHLFCFFFGILADDTPPVGLAAYAGAAIARSNPIKTGVQGFLYDLRTAILPFMFVFNTDLLLIDVHGWWHVGIVFFGAAVAMFAFAALTQNFMVARNRIHESLLLAMSATLLLQPRLPAQLLGWAPTGIAGSKFTWIAAGTLLFAAVYLLQRARAPAAKRA